MRESSNSIETAERSGKLKKSGVVPQPITWRPCRVSRFSIFVGRRAQEDCDTID